MSGGTSLDHGKVCAFALNLRFQNGGSGIPLAVVDSPKSRALPGHLPSSSGRGRTDSVGLEGVRGITALSEDFSQTLQLSVQPAF